MEAREKYLDKNAMRICVNLFNAAKHSNLKKSFSRWRLNSFKACVVAKLAAELRLKLTKEKHEAELK